MLASSKADVFPRDLSPTVHQLAYPEKNFKFFANENVKIFVMHLSEDLKMYYYRRAWTDKYEQHMRNIGKECQFFREFHPNHINWSSIASKLRKPSEQTHRANTDTRVGFKCADKFLVKSYFTFGLRTVQSDTAHIIQTLNVPLLFFLHDKKLHKKLRIDDGHFPYTEIHFYDRRILPPNGCFRIPPGTTYMIFSLQKNFFSLNIIAENDVISIPFTDPVKTRITKLETIYDMPVKTPYIEDEDREFVQHPALYHIFQEPPVEPEPMLEQPVHVFQPPTIFQPMPEQPTIFQPMPEQPPIFQPPQPMEQSFQPMALNRIEFLIPSILEKNVVVANQDFIENYQKLRWKPLDAPSQFSPDTSQDVQPMDLSMKMDFIDLDAEIDSEKLNDVMKDLYAAIEAPEKNTSF